MALLLSLLASLEVSLLAPSPACAEEFTPAKAAEVERAFYLGQIDDARRALAEHEGDGRISSVAWLVWEWRRWAGVAPFVHPEGTPGTTPATAAIPALLALHAEREQRESRGVAGLPESGPLAQLEDPHGLHAAFRALQSSVYAPSTPPDDEASAQAQRLREAAYRMAALGLGLCLALAAALRLTLGRTS